MFNTEDGTCVNELRRGSDNAFIFSIAFDIESKWLACSSDSLTVHIFSLKSTKKYEITMENSRTNLFRGDQQFVENGDEKVAKNTKSK